MSETIQDTVPLPSEPSDGVDLAALADGLTGALLLPDAAGYAAAAAPWNLAVTAIPDAVVEAADARDVQTTVRFANLHGLSVDVRATGHGATHDGGGTILIRTGALDDLELHADERWVRVGAGVTWASVLEATAPFGLAPLCGSAPGVGVVGLLTGGGFGPVARSYGVSSDLVRAFDVVTGDGELRRASATENPALFWALRGGKGALGVVTAVEFDLLPLASIFGGALFFDAADGDRVMRRWAEWSVGLPEAATTSIAICRFPPMPGVPEPLSGRTSVALRFAWTADPEQGRAALAPMLELAEPIFGGIDVMPYAAVGMIHADPTDPMPAQEAAALLHALPDDAMSALLSMAGPSAESPQIVVEIRQLGGAMSRTPRVADAFDHRDAAYVVNLIGIGAGPGAAPTAAHAAAVLDALAPWTSGDAFPNFAPSDDPARVRQVYRDDTLTRLGTLAATYDPREVIRASRPIRRALLLGDH